MARAGILIAAVAAALFVLSRCTLIAGNFNECTRDTDCVHGKTCVASVANPSEHYCVPQTIPAGCQGLGDAGIAATYGPADAGNAIHIGATLALTSGTGPKDGIIQQRVEQLNAVLLAFDEINQRPVGGRPFVLHVCDTQSDNTQVPVQVQWMADQLKVPAVLVPLSAQVLQAATVTIPRGMVLISPSGTSTEITSLAATPDGGTRLVWRTAPSDAIQGKVISELLQGTASYDAGLAGTQKVGILYVNDPYGQGLSATLQTALGAATPARPVVPIQYSSGGDLNTPMAQLDSAQPSVSVLIGHPQDAPQIVTQAATTTHLRRSSGHRWLFTDAAKDPGLISNSPSGEVDGDYGTAPAQGAGSAYNIFSNSFKSRFGVDPGSYAYTAHHYDAMYVLALGTAYAVGPNGTGALTGERIAEGLTKLSSGQLIQVGPTGFTQAAASLAQGNPINLDGTSGALDFDPATGEAPSPIDLWQVQGNGFKTVATITP